MSYEYIEWTDEKVKRFWDYESQFPQHYFTHQVGGNLSKFIKKYTRKNDLVLDYGAGPGFLIKHLLDKKMKVFALEFSSDSLNTIRNKYENKEGFMGAFSASEIEKNNIRFDVILLTEVIEHLNEDYLTRTFKDIHRFLKPEGVLFITTPNNEDLSQNMICCPETNQLFHRWQHVRTWDVDTLNKFVNESGYTVLKLATTDFNFTSFISKLKHPYFTFKFFVRKIFKRNKLPHLFCICSLNI